MGLVFVFACVVGLAVGPSLSVALQKFGDKSISQAGEPQNDLSLASNYLQKFYSFQTHPTGRTKRSEPSFSSKLKEMQSFFRLQPTGSLNPETLRVMNTPRCGVPDVQEYVSSLGNRWNKNVLSYRIMSYTNDLPMSTVDSLIGSALDVWEKASPLKFVKSSLQQADILVKFATRYHGDSYPFDGPRGTLAHAFDPGEGIGGDVHFDDDENWTADSKGFNLHRVAAHEFGHALGLRHSQNPDSLMYPTYKYKQTMLSSEDIRNINALYAPSTTQPVYNSLINWILNRWYTGFYRLKALKDKCDPDLTFDSVTTAGKLVFFFKDKYVWIKEREYIKEGLINDFMPKINSTIDAAYWVQQTSTIYLFSGPHYWTMKNFQVKSRRKKISEFGFPGWVDQIDAAVHIPKSGHTLFFTQDQYWRYNENRSSMERCYPCNISDDFPGVKTPISAAMYKRGFLYFFVGADVFKLDTKLKKVVSNTKANSWLGCK